MFRLGLLIAVAMMILGCGQVVTVIPTSTPEPTETIVMALAEATSPPTPTPAPYTPAPTSTATMTPTPLIHIVGSGDSLLGIATQYDVSLAALQEANAILDPRILQIGQELVIPQLIEDEESPISTPTPTPLTLEIQNVHFSQTKNNRLLVLGEVVNESTFAVEQVRVGVTLQDGAENTIAQTANLVEVALVDIGEHAPFGLLFTDVPQFERYRIYLVSAVPAYVGSYYRDLEVKDVVSKGERYASYTVTGRIFNFGPEEAVSVQVVLTGYDPLDRVVAMHTIAPTHNVIPRGGETTFSAVLTPTGGPIVRVKALAQGRRISNEQ